MTQMMIGNNGLPEREEAGEENVDKDSETIANKTIDSDGSRTIHNDSDESDDEDQRGKQKAAEVMAKLQAELADKAAALARQSFEVEGETEKIDDKPAVEEAVVEMFIENEKGDEEEEIISLAEAARRKVKGINKKPRKKEKGISKRTKPLKPYDFSKAQKEFDELSAKRKNKRTFDAMDKLKVEKDKERRPKTVKKRRRGQGKSMSFARK